MNYDEARQLKDGGWHWTTMNDGVVRTAAPCVRHVGDESDPLWYMQPSKAEDWAYCEPHETQEDAERHFYEWCLENVTEQKYTTKQLCSVEGCDEWSQFALGNNELGRFFGLGPNLCDAHRNREHLATLRPFHSPIRSVHS